MLTNPLLVAKANSYIGQAHGQANSAMGPWLRGGLFDLEASNLYDQICAIRFLKKFQEPSAAGARERKQACIDKWLATEESGRNVNFDSIPLCHKSILYRAKALLSTWLKDFSPGRDIDFTPGESFESHQGRTSVYHKLRLRSHWTCTPDAFDDFAKLVYNTTGLKRSAKRLMKPLSRRDSILLLSEHGSAFDVFKHRLMKDVVTFTHGSRLSTVRKNNEIDRAINIETTANMLLQRTVAAPLRVILANLNNDLEFGQNVHRARIADTTQATIDFSEASDCVWMVIVQNLFPSLLVKYLKRYRSEMVLVDDSYYWVNKLSSMGCGFTFEVMTMLLLAIARVLDPNATVYGDDVIISNSVASQYCEVMTAIGMKVNLKKSFICSRLRESCGAYHITDVGYVTCFDFHWCESWSDVTLTCNKLTHMIRDMQGDSPLKQIFSRLLQELLSLAPAFALGPICAELDTGFIQCRSHSAKQKRCPATRRLYHDVISQAVPFFEALNYDVSRISVCKIQHAYTTDLFARHNRTFRNMGARWQASLLAGQYAPVTVRGEVKYSEKLMVTHPDFGGVLLSELVRICQRDLRWCELGKNKNNLRVAD